VAAVVVADVGEEVDVTVEPGQSDGDIERAAPDVLTQDGTAAFDDVDQGFADDERSAHARSASRVARAPLRCNESKAHV
jgi:hypothetical protein